MNLSEELERTPEKRGEKRLLLTPDEKSKWTITSAEELKKKETIS